MKIKTTDAARNLAIHPAHLLLHIAELDKSLTFNDVWPEIDDAWVHTIAEMGGHRSAPSEAPPQSRLTPAPQSSLSENAVHVLDKLSRKDKFGKTSVPLEALQNMVHVPTRDLQDVIDELREAGFLDQDGKSGRGRISLDSARQKDVERIVQQPRGLVSPPVPETTAGQ